MAAAKAFFQIPIMTESVLPDVDYLFRMEILESAFARLDIDPDREYPSPWAYFVAKLAYKYPFFVV